MNPRVRKHAELIVDHSTEVEAGDNVVISASSAAEDLTLALCEAVGERGGSPFHVSYRQDKTRAAFLRRPTPRNSTRRTTNSRWPRPPTYGFTFGRARTSPT